MTVNVSSCRGTVEIPVGCHKNLMPNITFPIAEQQESGNGAGRQQSCTHNMVLYDICNKLYKW